MLVKRIAGNVYREHPVDILDPEDYVGVGVVGLIEAESRYDESRGVALDNYAYPRIRGSMLDQARQNLPFSRSTNKAKERIEAARDKLMKDGDSPTLQEIAEVVGESLSWVEEYAEISNSSLSLDQNAYLEDESEMSMHEIVADSNEINPEEYAIQQHRLKKIIEEINELDEVEKEVMLLLYEDGLSLEEVGAELGFSESRAGQIKKSELTKLRGKLLDREEQIRVGKTEKNLSLIKGDGYPYIYKVASGEEKGRIDLRGFSREEVLSAPSGDAIYKAVGRRLFNQVGIVTERELTGAVLSEDNQLSSNSSFLKCSIVEVRKLAKRSGWKVYSTRQFRPYCCFAVPSSVTDLVNDGEVLRIPIPGLQELVSEFIERTGYDISSLLSFEFNPQAKSVILKERISYLQLNTLVTLLQSPDFTVSYVKIANDLISHSVSKSSVRAVIDRLRGRFVLLNLPLDIVEKEHSYRLVVVD